MFAGVPSVLSRRVFYPLWDLWDRSGKLREFRRLRDAEREPWESRRARQWESLRKIVAHAYATVPFYKSRGPAPVLDRWEDVQDIPLLSKDDVRRRRDELISGAFGKEDLRRAKTGGSTIFWRELSSTPSWKPISSEIFCAVPSCWLGFIYMRTAQLPTMPSALG